ncbi:MAG: tetratricopeptide repeat protein [Methylococcales bacterium]|nr:tetratricopeptide repeat protein [Methylococcales bacterium]
MRFLAIFCLLAGLFVKVVNAETDGPNNLLLQQWGSEPDHNDPVWQFRQGKMYDKGEGVAQDKATALSWYRKSAEQGYAEAQLLLGIIYDQGIGVSRDYVQAVEWYRKAAEQGYARAQYNLAAMYDEGLGVEHDYRQAADWYRKSAEQGFARAQFNLGSMYFKGEGVERSAIQGYKWLQLAAAHGLEEQVKSFLGLEPPMSKAEIKKAEKLIAEWRTKHKPSVTIP